MPWLLALFRPLLGQTWIIAAAAVVLVLAGLVWAFGTWLDRIDDARERATAALVEAATVAAKQEAKLERLQQTMEMERQAAQQALDARRNADRLASLADRERDELQAELAKVRRSLQERPPAIPVRDPRRDAGCVAVPAARPENGKIPPAVLDSLFRADGLFRARSGLGGVDRGADRGTAAPGRDTDLPERLLAPSDDQPRLDDGP